MIPKIEQTQKYIEKVMGYKTYSQKRKVDSLLEYDTNMYTNLGTDSSKEDKDLVNKNSLLIYREMKKIDWQLGCALLLSMGKLK